MNSLSVTPVVMIKLEERDRLSHLSDDLLHQIFSGFTLKQVIQTCILSKKWRYFWTTLSVLNFNSDSLERDDSLKTIKFDHLVTQVLHRGCKNSIINTLNVIAFHQCSEMNIKAWIEIAVNRNIQTMDIRFHEPDFWSISLPTLFTCQSLKKLVLVLNMRPKGGPVRIPLPDSIDLPRLKELSLCAVCRLSTRFLDKLFSGCRVLEMLLITNCTFDKSQSLVITSNMLKRLVIDLCGDKYGGRKCEITIHAPTLIWFKCIDWCSNNYHLDNVASLETMYLDNGRRWNVTVQDAKRTVKWLKEISSVKSLTLHDRVFEVVSQYLDILHRVPLSFGNLSYLNVRIQIVEDYVQALKCILKNSPNIKTLIVQNTWQENSTEISDGWGDGLSLQNLKCVELHSVEGFDNELGLLKGLLKNAMSLEEMTIFTS
ncbi:hypothetical protein ACHQM5_006041 [Ranunculus cassubicifolius]